MKRRGQKRKVLRPLGISSPHFDKQGKPKNAYRGELEARQAAAATFAIHGIDLDSYRCSECHAWHNGRRFAE
jgi:hypothetical protein